MWRCHAMEPLHQVHHEDSRWEHRRYKFEASSCTCMCPMPIIAKVMRAIGGIVSSQLILRQWSAGPRTAGSGQLSAAELPKTPSLSIF